MKPLILFLGVVSSAGVAQTIDPAAVTEILESSDRLEAPGCVAGAFRNGSPIFVRGAGVADLQRKKPLNGDSVFPAASVSKQFTALAAAKLIEQGKLSLDDDAGKYLPELRTQDAPVTVGMLMHNTSGVKDWIALLLLSGGEVSAISRVEALGLLLKQKTNFTPGTRWEYSNGGFLLLSEIVARASGMPFEAYATKVILKPLGMKKSMFMNGALPKTANLVSGHVPEVGGYAPENDYARISGAGGLMTTMNDLAKYERDVAIGGRVWTPAVRKIMLTPGKLTSGEAAVTNTGTGYGGGLYIGQRYGQEFVAHLGGNAGFAMAYLRMPERKLGVILNCNHVEANVTQKGQKLIELIEGDILSSPGNSGQLKQAPAPASSTAQAPKAAAAAVKVPANVSGKYVSDELPASYELSEKDGQLEVTILSPFAPASGIKVRNFKALPNGSFQGGPLTIRFEPDGKGLTVSGGAAKDIRFYRAP
ncbi:MAG TPA: serine hydrolase domain-containing protein [Allosphingosinicella sp.]|jgi:CubicO group peptidase (beta-lactamase class C family)